LLIRANFVVNKPLQGYLWRLFGSFDHLENPAASDGDTLEIPGLFVIMMDSDDEKLITFGGCFP